MAFYAQGKWFSFTIEDRMNYDRMNYDRTKKKKKRWDLTTRG